MATNRPRPRSHYIPPLRRGYAPPRVRAGQRAEAESPTLVVHVRGVAPHTKCSSAVAFRIAGNRTTSIPGAVRFLGVDPIVRGLARRRSSDDRSWHATRLAPLAHEWRPGDRT